MGTETENGTGVENGCGVENIIKCVTGCGIESDTGIHLEINRDTKDEGIRHTSMLAQLRALVVWARTNKRAEQCLPGQPIDQDGLLSEESAHTHAKKLLSDEEDLRKAQEMMHECSSVNDEPVSDGKKGCDRAMLVMNCLLKKADKGIRHIRGLIITTSPLKKPQRIRHTTKPAGPPPRALPSLIDLRRTLGVRLYRPFVDYKTRGPAARSPLHCEHLHGVYSEKSNSTKSSKMFKLGVIGFTLAIVAPKCVLGTTEEQKAKVQAQFLTVGAECITDYPLSGDDITAFKEKKFPDGDNAACFAACMFKKIGIMDDSGKLSSSGAQDAAKKVFDADEDLKKVEEFISTCSSVNDEDVGDDEKGCARAKLAHTCLVDNSAKDADLTDFQKSKLSDHFITFGVSCIAQNPLNFEDIQALKSLTMPKSDTAFCFFGCVLKRAGLLGSDGKLSPDAVLNVVNQVFDDKDERDKVIMVFTSCAYVNDASLDDDEKGCKRAKLVLSCLIKESDKGDGSDKAEGAVRSISTRNTVS
ncbi:hypothetical protein EVAR_81585_1 [Eumeta japonica]|uniref:Uncharacterized protein n=1 Tax=Eumeta variegata TaxID=151549 RepID=A0A4C1V009_EUMVA|nr:hypothetical protein EVAR_81585_1 [Eumeta japonica]